LTRGSERPVTYISGEANDPATDYDADCGGYPVGDKTPAHWKDKAQHVYDTRRPGLSRMGHDEKIFLKDGKEIMTSTEKRELVEFLKTL
jgi:hypothetical protein